MQALRAFEAAAREQSLTRAATSLHRTHGAISHQIKALEADLGVRLVERAGRGIRLTDEGARFAARVSAALTELAAAVREVADRNNPRLLRISVTPSFAARWLLPRIGRFLQRHPEIDLDISASLSLVDFAREDVDVALRYGRGGYEGVLFEKVLDDEYFPVASPRFNGGRLPGRPQDLPQHLLLRSENEFWRPWFLAAGVDVPEPIRGPMFNDASMMLEAAVAGQGIALARSSLVAADLRDARLVRLFELSIPSSNSYFLVFPRRLEGAPKIVAFRSWLLEEIASGKAEQAPAAAKTSLVRPGAKTVHPRKPAKRIESRGS
jgi:LysR family glycine cleavage system transcriptional activator